MVNDFDADPLTGRYGPVGFAATMASILVVDFVTWLCVPWIVVAIFFLVPFFLAMVAVSAVLARRPGKTGQAARGILIGALSGPLSLLIFLPAFFAAGAMGMI